jgi:hypothetical protein
MYVYYMTQFGRQRERSCLIADISKLAVVPETCGIMPYVFVVWFI